VLVSWVKAIIKGEGGRAVTMTSLPLSAMEMEVRLGLVLRKVQEAFI
jgi:hypothetical protein